MSILKEDYTIDLPTIGDLFLVHVGFTHIDELKQEYLKGYISRQGEALYGYQIRDVIKALQTTYDSNYAAWKAAGILSSNVNREEVNVQVSKCGPTAGSKRVWIQIRIDDSWRDLIYVNLVRRGTEIETYQI